MSTPHSPAAERNKQVILERLLALLPPAGSALEVASGTGQHVAHFAAALPGWRWQPTDLVADLFDAIAQRTSQAGLISVAPARCLDVLAEDWGLDAARFDLIYCANMLHIAPWACCMGLMQGAARHLAPQGRLVTYGPYYEADVSPAPSNLEFDLSLKARNPAWGIRHVDAVREQAAQAGLALVERHAMPANNLLLVWQLGT